MTDAVWPPVLRSVAIVFRHGARGFTGSSQAALLRYGAGSAHACNDWAAAELEHITSVGEQQMRALGAWFGARYAPLVRNTRRPANGVSLKWRSSLTQRVVESGAAFLAGAAASGLTDAESVGAPQSYACDAMADAIFRNWHVDPTFMSATAAVKASDEFIVAARSAAPQLASLYAALSGELVQPGEDSAPPAAAGCALPPGFTTTAAAAAASDRKAEPPLGSRLYHVTYIKELHDCEVFWPGEPPKALLRSRLSPADEAFMRRAAAWVWEQRFFSHAATRNMGPRIGGALLSEILADASAGVPVSVYSAHDYTLLALLAALKAPFYDAPGFGSFLLVETYETPRLPGDAAASSSSSPHRNKSVTVRLCSEPFPLEKAKGGERAALSTEGMVTVAADVALDSLLYLVSKWPAVEVAGGNEAAASAH